MVKGFVVVFTGEDPPDWGKLCSMLEQGQEFDKYDAEFAVQELPKHEAEAILDPRVGSHK